MVKRQKACSCSDDDGDDDDSDDGDDDDDDYYSDDDSDESESDDGNTLSWTVRLRPGRRQSALKCKPSQQLGDGPVQGDYGY